MGNDKLDPRKMSDEQLFDIVKDEARKLDIVPYPIPDVLAKVREHYCDWGKYLDFRWKSQYDNYVQACISWALDEVKAENPIENKLYYELERYANQTGVSETEKKRVEGIVSMLSTQGIFPKDETSFYTLREVMQWLDPEGQQALVDAVLHLKDYCDAEGVRSVLESADVNETKWKVLLQDSNGRNLSENEKRYQPATFVRRLELMARYIRDTADKNFSETETLGMRYWLKSTGADPHCEGRHALFLVDKASGDIVFVYKPHDLSADNAVVGEDGMFAVVNELFPADKTFVIVHIEPEKHLETYVKKLHAMDKEKAKSYFYKAGMLQVITDAMAVTDLHQDNIMPTKDGPLIIDAEVDFFRANFSGLLSALTWPDSDEYPRTACFSIDEGNGKILRSGVAFQNEQSTYRIKYREGQTFMLNVMKDHIDYLLEEFDKQLQRVTKSRILPLSTKEFSDHLQRSMRFNRTAEKSYVPSVALKYEEDHKHSINELASDVINNIKKKFADAKEGYIFTGKAGVYFREDEFVQSIMETFENGTIIAMYIDMDGNIYLDDRPVGYLYELGDKSDGSTEPPRQLFREQVIGMIKDHFVEKLKAIKIQMEVK